jgi:hypothetical protein
MSRAVHDIGCQNCNFQGKVPDDVITCPECGQSVEGVAITGEALEAMIARIKQRQAISIEQSGSKEIKG